LGVDLSRIYAVSTPVRKKEIVEDLKREYKHVVMVGDGLNDIYALQAADLGVLTVQQDTRPAKILFAASDETISDIRELPELLKNSRIIL
jgi:Cu+-exporting ATPase